MGIPILKVDDSFSYLSERRYLAHPFSTSAVCIIVIIIIIVVNSYCFSIPLHSLMWSGVEQTFVCRYIRK